MVQSLCDRVYFGDGICVKLDLENGEEEKLQKHILQDEQEN